MSHRGFNDHWRSSSEVLEFARRKLKRIIYKDGKFFFQESRFIKKELTPGEATEMVTRILAEYYQPVYFDTVSRELNKIRDNTTVDKELAKIIFRNSTFYFRETRLSKGRELTSSEVEEMIGTILNKYGSKRTVERSQILRIMTAIQSR